MNTATTVWMSVARKDTAYHWVTSSAGDKPGQVHLYTMCQRYIGNGGDVRHGVLLPDTEAAELGGPCVRCWPDGRQG